MKSRCLIAVLFAAALQAVGHPGMAMSAATATATAEDPLARGKYLVVLGDCAPCHTRAGGQAFAGGRGLNTPFGTIYSANITPDPMTGIGNWSAEQFYRALHEGIDAAGRHLYPAFPYTYFTHIPRADTDAMFAYLRSLDPIAQATPSNQLAFPLTVRSLLAIWNAMYLKKGSFRPTPNRSTQWNRGAYLVTGPGHCGACHTPKNLLGADRQTRALTGATLDDWYAADLTETPRAGLAAWSLDEIVEFLKDGRNARAAASGSMQEVIEFSTGLMSDADLRAIAVYLKDQPSRAGAQRDRQPEVADLRAGAAIFADECSACHRMQAAGVPGLFPPLVGDSTLQSRNATTVIRIILEGSRSPVTAAKPTPLTMPAFAWKLRDGDIAAVVNYLRDSWGNQAPIVRPRAVHRLRDRIALPP